MSTEDIVLRDQFAIALAPVVSAAVVGSDRNEFLERASTRTYELAQALVDRRNALLKADDDAEKAKAAQWHADQLAAAQHEDEPIQ